MAEYINKADVWGIIKKGHNIYKSIKLIRELPTIDIVTCKECKHNTGGECRKVPMGFDIACYDQWVEPEDDFFCKCGERKDNNG